MCDYGGTSIKRTPLGNILLAALIIEVVFLDRFRLPAMYTQCMSYLLLQMNLGALLTASLAHTSFEKTVTTAIGFTIVQNNAISAIMLLILGVHGLSVLGGYFPLLKRIGGLERLVIQSREDWWLLLRGCFTLKSL